MKEYIVLAIGGIFRVLSGEKDKVKGMGFSYISTTELEEYRKGINP